MFVKNIIKRFSAIAIVSQAINVDKFIGELNNEKHKLQ